MQNNNPYENIIQKTDSYAIEVKKMLHAFEDYKKKRVDITQREAILAKDRENLDNQEVKIQGNLVTLLNTIFAYLSETVTYSNEMFRRSQTEIQYRMQAEAAQRALAEAAQKALSEAAERAKAEADYRRQSEAAQNQLIAQAQQAQVEAAKRIQVELNQPTNVSLSKRSSTDVETFEPRKTGFTRVDRSNSESDSDVITIESITSKRLGNTSKRSL